MVSSSAVEADTPTLEVGEEADTPVHKPRPMAGPAPHTWINAINYL